MDWVANNLYWTDSTSMNIQVLDLDSMHLKKLLQTGPETIPGAIAVDPRTRLVNLMGWI